MASIEDLWSRFSLTEEEENGADVPRKTEVPIVRLAAKFLTKRVVNAEAVSRTFKPLWRLIGEMKIRDIGGNILLFEFDDALDLERVLELEPWTYDKSLVVFRRAVDVETAPLLPFDSVTFWIQLHNVPEQCLTKATGEVVGNTIGGLVQVADPEDDGEGGEFLRVRVVVDIKKSLPRCCKLWSEGEHIGWALLKFERLPNFCYWCGKVTHGENDCDVWLRGKGRLKKEEQQYGEWLRAEPVRRARKTVVVVSGKACGKPSWKKGPAMARKQPATKDLNNAGVLGSDLGREDAVEQAQPEAVLMEAEPSGEPAFYHATLNRNGDDVNGELPEVLVNSMESLVGPGQPSVTKPMQKNLSNDVGGGHSEGLNDYFSFGAIQTPLADITNRLATQPLTSSKKKWTKLLREIGESNSSSDMETVESRRPDLETVDLTIRKKKKVCVVSKGGNENNQVVAGFQHHRSQ